MTNEELKVFWVKFRFKHFRPKVKHWSWSVFRHALCHPFKAVSAFIEAEIELDEYRKKEEAKKYDNRRA